VLILFGTYIPKTINNENSIEKILFNKVQQNCFTQGSS
jgi:hypothetical protein